MGEETEGCEYAEVKDGSAEEGKHGGVLRGNEGMKRVCQRGQTATEERWMLRKERASTERIAQTERERVWHCATLQQQH